MKNKLTLILVFACVMLALANVAQWRLRMQSERRADAWQQEAHKVLAALQNLNRSLP